MPADPLAAPSTSPHPSPWPARLLTGAALGTTLIAAHVYSARYHHNVVDDALISFQYAKNWAQGHGVVFNLGERVEGYTNFLWVLVLAALYHATRLAHLPFVRAVIQLGIGLACVNLFLVHRIAARSFGRSLLASGVALGLCALDGAYLGWAVFGMETQLLLLLVLATLWLTEAPIRYRAVWLGLALAGAQMTRPDAALLGLVIGADSAFSLLAALRDRAARRTRALDLFQMVGTFSLAYGLYFAWRIHYYGWLFPNTYYLKLGSSHLDAWGRGFRYLGEFVTDRAGWPLLALGTVPFVRRRRVRLLLAFCLAHALYVAYVGGDFYPGHRFLVLLVPPLALLVAECFYAAERRVAGRSPLWRGRGRVGLTALAAVVVIGATIFAGRRGPWTTEIARWGDVVEATRKFMIYIGETRPPGATLATGDIGSAGFYADCRVIDLYGVIDPDIAHRDAPTLGHGKAGHEKIADTETVLAKRPTYIKTGYLPGDLWQRGYFLESEFPAGITAEGIWRRDDLAAAGHFLPVAAFHFDRDSLGAFEPSGTAFENQPALGPRLGQSWISGTAGPFINSYHAQLGDRATGRLLSPPFVLQGDRLVFRVGGGRDPERLRASLWVGNERRFSATGQDSEQLGRRSWDISALRGQTARLEIVDDATGRWGHILVDEVEQWVLEK